ncbi:MAG: hydrogenase maturation protease [Acidimicrobiia bacterium]|nr:hydrogenase maturation protease [Acidimicrobiia bacterium]MBT8213686.1 hydrogenase maturation protease [Acidimicrobiia bacterium]NNK91045.1 hydrogenase maturation protease [Acidimicrobiia bacterium]
MVDLVIGVGNEIRGDDRAGLAVIDALAGKGSAALLMRSDGDPLEMIDAWQGLSSVILVDAVSSGSPVGTIHRIDVGDGPLPTMLASRSTHLFGIGEAVELARTLDRLPPSLIVYGIEGSRFAPGSDMSRPVAESVTTVVEELASLLEGAHA